MSEFLNDEDTFPGSDLMDRYNMLLGKQVLITYYRGKDQKARDQDAKDVEGRVKAIFAFSNRSVTETEFSADVEGRQVKKKVGAYLKSSTYRRLRLWATLT